MELALIVVLTSAKFLNRFKNGGMVSKAYADSNAKKKNGTRKIPVDLESPTKQRLLTYIFFWFVY